MKRRCTQKNTFLQVIHTTADGKYICKAEEGCNYQQETLMPGNFKRHLHKMHPTVFAAMDLPAPAAVGNAAEPSKKKSRKLLVDTDQGKIRLGLLQLATVNNLPHSFPEIGFKTLVGDLCKAADVTFHRKAVANLVGASAFAAQKLITAELKQQHLIAIEVDGASRGSRHFVGINARFIVDGEVVVRNLAIRETLERQTKEHLKSLMEEVLSKFGVKLNQVYSVTHDNGANMVASVTEMKKSLELSNIELSTLVDTSCFDDNCEDDKDLSDTDDDDWQAYQNEPADSDSESDDANDDFNHGKEGDELRENTPEADPFDNSMQHVLGSVRCAAHTAQLAVWDVLKTYDKRIKQIQKLVVKLRQREYYKFAKQHDAHLPPISNRTRWNSTYLMLKSLMKQKSFFNMFKKAFPEIDFTPHSKFIDKFCEAFEAPFILTMQLQKRHVVLSEFYACWLVCQAKLMQLKENCLARRLLKACQQRLEKLTDSIHFKACVYLDPRINFLGSKRISSKDKELVHEFFMKLHDRVNGKPDNVSSVPDFDMNEDELESILAGYFDEDSQANTSLTSDSSFAQKLKQLEMREKIPIIAPGTASPSNDKKPAKFDLIKYWEAQKYTNPDLYRVAMIVFTASATQVSVERSFSALKLILRDQRMNLNSESVENSLLLKLNPDLLPRIIATIDGDTANI
ncbi:uncharacterized protein LOC115265169 [Aedes albopictus]|uniref:HAT C-terminal dimerisation domain-containing protein n=1 Tax=Aedes albopictus TaxID=7160 RepID=A0ABM1ZUF3_AEDAL